MLTLHVILVRVENKVILTTGTVSVLQDAVVSPWPVQVEIRHLCDTLNTEPSLNSLVVFNTYIEWNLMNNLNLININNVM